MPPAEPPKVVTATVPLLTRAHCEKILAKACGTESNLQLKEFTLKPAIYTSGFLGEYYHLLVCFSAAAVAVAANENENLANRRNLQELRAFVKRVPQASVEPEKEAIFRKEAALYGTLLERLRKYSTVSWSPLCFYTRDDIIVLEQLDERNYALCSETVNVLSEHYMRSVLRGLAAQHASCFTLETKEGICIGDAYPQLQEEITVSAQVPWYTTGLRAILAVAKSQLVSQSIDVRTEIESRLASAAESVYEMTNRSSKYRNVLCHRDIWRGNIFYSSVATSTDTNANERSVIFVDYQTARYCPPAIDVIFALFMNLDKSTRKSKEKEYLRYYYDCLERDLSSKGLIAADHLTYSDLLASYEELQLFGLFYRAIATTIVKVPRQYVTNDYVHVERTEAVFKLMESQPQFREYLEECIHEMLEFLIAQNAK
ncbi:uncharacterized protein LOC118742154 [Rhagoletis pomonella]|uniref:uncharacterized protein LOC118742154 n=1 Tax=Rhagoletis pomonella TaxID=28610 RepID=UPI0017855DAA|nr:uncharacterized protein LOC118742154 [Rhagoletis pomonella]